jgi:succinate dehydrogenase/fumarate reductase flavoprotein subunit
MKPDKLIVGPNEFKVYRLNTVVVGSGAAGLNAADCLYDLGVRDIAIVTEGMNRGTSRNTGSDKQTYYKISTGGDVPDSPVEMAKDLVKGGAMHGDIALTEAACSFRCFSKLIDLGVPFPHNEYGEYVGYKTDHDPKARATSAGPLTSRYMTEALERSVRLKNIPVIDNVLITGIITAGEEEKECIGLVGVDLTVSEGISEQLVLFNCTNVIFATGGPAGIYRDSVYPESQVGSNGIAFEAGVRGMNVIESQYGIASVKFRWNLSGSYQQVIPRYVSTDREGNDPTEFLTPYFDSPGKLLTAVFLKGYQWPFDPRKIKGQKSSFIDLLVYNEIYNKGRRVFLDYTKNPLCSLKDGAFDFSLLEEEAYTYMANCDILFGTPIERLIKMNKPAYELYLSHGIDLKKDWLEISVCAQHNNGGLFANNRWESNIKHFFPVGECAGTFGIYRPGGSALNNTQVSSLRAVEYIAAKYNNPPRDNRRFLILGEKQIQRIVKTAGSLLSAKSEVSNIEEELDAVKRIMSKTGGHIRNPGEIKSALEHLKDRILRFTEIMKIKDSKELGPALKNKDLFITAYVYLSAILDYIRKGGKSRGSYLILDEFFDDITEEVIEGITIDTDTTKSKVQIVSYDEKNVSCTVTYENTRPIPDRDTWFETVWNKFLENKIF